MLTEPPVGDDATSRFGGHEPRRHALGYVTSLLATVERKNGWPLAEIIGPGGTGRLAAALGL
jgi:hypothetical protein